MSLADFIAEEIEAEERYAEQRVNLVVVCHNATYATWSQDRRCAECGADLSVGWVRQGERVVLCAECRGEAEDGN